MLMKSGPYPIPYPADPGIDSGPAVGHQQQAVREDIPRIGFPKGVEQETAQYGNEADVDVEPVRSAPCGLPRRLPGNFRFPTLIKTVNTEHHHAQIQNILPCIAPFDISPTERTFIDFFKKCTPSSVGCQGSLAAGIGAVRPLG